MQDVCTLDIVFIAVVVQELAAFVSDVGHTARVKREAKLRSSV